MTFIDDFNRLRNNKIFNKIIITIIIFILLIISSFFMIKYQVEGESNLPFLITKIIVISSAEGIDIESSETKWAFNITQNNDIYININKNEKHEKNETIKRIKIENIQTNKKGSETLGNIKNYKPAKEGLFKNEEQYIITEKIEYSGDSISNIGEQKIGNQRRNNTIQKF